MGGFATKFRDDHSSELGRHCHPRNADWITKHAVITKLAIVEVERLWNRFQQLGSNDDGEITDEVFQGSSPIMQDIFARNILTTLRSDDGTIKFLTFINCMQWAEIATLEEKITATFQLLNNGKPLRRDILQRIITRMYPNDDKKEHNRLTDILMTQLCGIVNGEISEPQFVNRVKSLPADLTTRLFSFLIVPNEINEEAHRTFTSLSKGTFGRLTGYMNSAIPEETEPDAQKQIPSDAILKQISEKISGRDWHKVANKLSFTAADISQFESKHEDSTSDQVLDMLKAWKLRDGRVAYAETLEKCLQECNMTDAALLLYP